jgi:hypothetical protein
MIIRLSDAETGINVLVAGFELGGERFITTAQAMLMVPPEYTPVLVPLLGDDLGHWIDGKKGSEVMWKLHSIVKRLGVVKDKDFKNPTDGNVGYILSLLEKWARKYPRAVFQIGLGEVSQLNLFSR